MHVRWISPKLESILELRFLSPNRPKEFLNFLLPIQTLSKIRKNQKTLGRSKRLKTDFNFGEIRHTQGLAEYEEQIIEA